MSAALHLKGIRTCHIHPDAHAASECPGAGNIRCMICDAPVAAHPHLGPCPMWDANRYGPLTLPEASVRTIYRRRAEGRT